MQDIQTKCWILALFIREDGQRLLLGDGAYEFAEKQQHFASDKINSTVIDVQGNNGVFLAAQTKRASNQTFTGYIGDASLSKQEVESYRRAFINFFEINKIYEVVYIFPDSTAIKRQRGFIVNAPSVEEMFQIHPSYNITLNFEDVNYYKYEEDANGNEIYGQNANIKLANAVLGGYVWDNKGLTWDSNGAISLPGQGGNTNIKIDSSSQVYPILVIKGPATNPRLTNITTGQTISYLGAVGVGQTLEIDMLNHTAKLDGSNLVQNVKGLWLSFAPGVNEVRYSTDNNNAFDATIKWSEVVL